MPKSIPSREQLVQQLESANRLAPLWIFLQLVGISIAGATIDWPRAVREPLVPAVGIAVMIGSWGLGLFRLWGQNKKEIGGLKETTQFGEFNKHNLRTLFNDTLRRLGLPDDQLPVFITADKSLNAGAVRLGLFGFLRSLNGVYLNRQVLHKLNSAEVQDIMGHELGHYYRYYLVADRFRFVTLVLGALVGIVVAQLTFTADLTGVLVLVGVSWLFWWVSGLSWARHGQAIEYLCDDFGSQVNGVIHSINGLMKIGADEELRYTIHAEMLLNAKDFGNLSTSEIVESVDRSIPYGHTSAKELREAIISELKQKAHQGDLSVSGFLKFAWGGAEDDEAIENFQTTARALSALPRLDWESLLPRDTGISFDFAGAERLVRLIESNPDRILFRLPDAAGSVDGIHPSLKSRILFLWHNHSEPQTPS